MNKDYWIALGIFVGVGALLFAALLLLLAPTSGALAGTPSIEGTSRRPVPTQPVSANLDEETLRISKSLYCPVCPGTPLDVCETQACQQWRALIRQKLEEGQSPAQIEAYFVEQYGERVLGAPRAQGLNLLVYGLPAAAIAGGAAALYLVARRWLAPHPPSGVVIAAAIPDEYRARIERELRDE